MDVQTKIIIYSVLWPVMARELRDVMKYALKIDEIKQTFKIVYLRLRWPWIPWDIPGKEHGRNKLWLHKEWGKIKRNAKEVQRKFNMMNVNRITHFVCGWKLSSNFGRIILEKSRLVIPRSRSIFRNWQGIFLFSKEIRTSLVPTQPSIQWVLAFITQGYGGRAWKLTTQLHLHPRLRMRNYTSTSHLPLYRELAQLYLLFMQWGQVHIRLHEAPWFLQWLSAFQVGAGTPKSVPEQAMKANRGSGVIPPLVLNLGSTWRWGVSFARRKLVYTVLERIADFIGSYNLQYRSRMDWTSEVWRAEKCTTK